MPNIFLSFFICFVSLLLAAQHLSLAVVCDSTVALLCVFEYYYCMCQKSYTFIFLFFIRARLCLFLSSHGSSLIGFPFPLSSCLSVVFVHVACAVFWFT